MMGTLAEAAPAVAAVAPRRGEKVRSDGLFALGLGAVYFLLELVNVLHHAMWRDEIQVWSLSQRCTSLLQFLKLKKYEDLGHPDAWHLLVYPVSRFTSNPAAMQFLHLAIATVTAYVIARCAPFTRLQKIAMVFGYFLFYEYATISRGYAIGVLGAFVFCALFKPGPKKNYLTLAIVLSAMAQSNIQALMLATAFALMLVYEAARDGKPRQFLAGEAGKFALGAAVFVAAILFSALRMSPPKDSIFYPASHFPVDPTSVGRTLAMMWKAFVPVPQLTREFWNTNIVPSQPLVAVLSIGVLAVSFLFFIRRPVVLFLYAAGLGALLLFRHVKYAGYLRHDGHAFILFLACVWLAAYYPREEFPIPRVNSMGKWFEPKQKSVFAGLLLVQVVAAMIASGIALKVPFSQAKATASYLRAEHLDKMYIVGDFDAPLATLAGYLQRDIYYPRGDRMGTYIVWDTKRDIYPSQPILDVGKQKADALGQDVLVILNQPAPAMRPFAKEVAAFGGSIVGSESFYIYRISYQAAAAAASGAD